MKRIRELSKKEINESYLRAQPLSQAQVYKIYNQTDCWLQDNDPLLKEKGKNYVRNARIRALHRGGGFLGEADEYSLSYKDLLQKEAGEREEQQAKLKELLQELEAALPFCQKPRDIIVFRLLQEGLDATEIADELNKTRQAIYEAFNRLNKGFKEHFKEQKNAELLAAFFGGDQ